MVEDHPLDYANFEGKIPEGNYGAGSVEIWDTGYWFPLDKYKNISSALKDGELEFVLEGNKLEGEFILVRFEHADTKNAWLLIKKTDDNSTHKKYDANEIKS